MMVCDASFTLQRISLSMVTVTVSDPSGDVMLFCVGRACADTTARRAKSENKSLFILIVFKIKVSLRWFKGKNFFTRCKKFLTLLEINTTIGL